jgi:ribose-phosphate pyrophosphokinase
VYVQTTICAERDMKVFSGNANPELAREIVHFLDIPLGDAQVTHFADGETRVTIGESVRGRDLFLIQPTCAPSNERVFELLVMIDACRRASARRITCVIPYYGYGRQDRKAGPREPITAKLVADMLVAAGASRILSVELHADQIMGFFNIPVDQLKVGGMFIDHLRDHELRRQFADLLGAQLVIVAKRRGRANECEVMEVIGDVAGKLCVFRDDMIDTAGSMVQGAFALRSRGAAGVIAVATHPVLSSGATSRLRSAGFERVIVANTIPVPEDKRFPQLEVLSVAPLLAEAIRCVHEDRSVSDLIR